MNWAIEVGEDTTSALFEPATAPETGTTVVCAHGAGGQMNDKAVVAITEALRARGANTVRFNFLYRAQGRGRPDAMPRLLSCFQAVVARVRAEVRPRRLVLGGRSMGGRVASVLASQGEACDGLLLLAYPLHPPGRPGQSRTAHLPAISVPVLCLSGTNDPFATPTHLMTRTVEALGPRWQLHWLDQADHSFHVLKRSGRTNEAVTAEAADVAARWMASLDPVG